MKRKFVWPVLILLLVLCITGLFLLIRFGIQRIPTMEEQIPPGSTSIQIRITHPNSKSGWPLNFAIPIQITAQGQQPVTSIELYVNGMLYDTQSIETDQQNQPYLTLWHWQPGTTGKFILVARALDVFGGTGISNAVMIEAGPAIGSGSPLTIEEGNTWENISLTTNLPLDVIQQANPNLDPDISLAPGSQILLPNPPEPVVNPNIIPGYNPQGETSSIPELSPLPEEESVSAPKWNFINDLRFFIKAAAQQDNKPIQQVVPTDVAQNTPPDGEDSTKLPPAPKIFGSFNNCNVSLNVSPLPDPTEDGYFIYRSRNGTEFERIATLPPYTDSSLSGDSRFTDLNQYGLVTYYAASFNVNGENPGPPVSFPLNEMNCSGDILEPTNKPKIDESGDLILPFNTDTAYLYLQINDSQAVRVPEGDRMFLPDSGVNFNLDLYLDSLVNSLTDTDLSVHMEIWGWQGGKLIYIGDLDHNVHRTVLTVCSVEGEGGCTNGGVGEWVREMNILPNFLIPLNEQKYELRWQTSALSETERICLAIGENDFDGPGLTDTHRTVLKVCYYADGNEGVYLLDFSKILYPDGNPKYPPYSGPGYDYQSSSFEQDYPMGTPFNLAIHVLSVMEENGFSDMSNTVYMHHLTPYETTDLPPLASNVPSLYDIEILEDTYQPPEYEIRSKWACVIIDEDPSGQFSPGQEVCPLTYVECGVNITCEDPGFWGMLGLGWDMVVDTINGAKQEIATAISDTIPYCDESTACKDAVKAGVDYGVAYTTGLPPHIPNSDEAVSQAITEAIVGELAYLSDEETVEYLCGDACKDEISAQIQARLKKAEYFYGQPGCYDLGDHYGYFPICFQPPTIVHAVPGSGNFPGYVFVRVTRKDTPESLAATSEMKDQTQLHLTVDVENANRIGEYMNTCKYQDNITVNQLPDPQNPSSNANRGYTALGDTPLAGQLYETIQVSIPWLEPGQSMDIAVILQPFHNKSPQNCITTARSQYYFYQGTSHMTATEYCFSPKSSVPWVPCNEGGSDTWDFDNPSGPGLSSALEDALDEVGSDVSEALP